MWGIENIYFKAVHLQFYYLHEHHAGMFFTSTRTFTIKHFLVTVFENIVHMHLLT